MGRNKKLLKQRLLKASLRDAASGVKRRKDAPQPPKHSIPHKSGKQKTPLASTSAIETAHASTSAAKIVHTPTSTSVRQDNLPRHKRVIPYPNPEVLGEPPYVEFQNEDPDNMRCHPGCTGVCDVGPTDEESINPDAVREMEFDERATWLGKWFAHHYAAWVSEFDMKQLQTYPAPGPITTKEWERVRHVTPLMMLSLTFGRFRLPQNEWQSPLFASPFRLGLRRFRNEVVSILRTHAIRIFSITDIVTIDDRNNSPQVADLHPSNKFLYEHGDTGSMERLMRSDCIIKALRVVLLGPAALDGPEKQKSPNVRATLFNVRSVRDTLTAFVATVLWFLLVDGQVFRDKGTEEGCKKYYHDRMKQLIKLRGELPDIYESYQKFMHANVFGEDKEQEVDPIEEAQAEYMKNFNADVDNERERRRKGKAKDVGTEDENTPGSSSVDGSAGDSG